jgi:hypothetical protein
MKAYLRSLRCLFLVCGLAAGPLLALNDQTPSATISATTVAAADTVYVQIDTFDPIAFDRMRYARDNGDELILNTLKKEAAAQAKYAELNYNVVVLDDAAAPPKGANVLRLTWANGEVLAELISPANAKPKFLGVVSRTSISYHPNGSQMLRDVDRAGLRDARRDASLRAQTQMHLYLGLQRVARELSKT